MSESQGGPGEREVAHRLFAATFDDADVSYSESEEERAPNYVVTPTGARVNRVFVVGVLTETETVSEDYLRARVVDPTGPFVVYAGQYQPEALSFLERADPPTFVAVTGKARTYSPEDSDRVFTSIRPESINEVDGDTRDRWVVTTSEHTVERVARMADARASGLAGDDLVAALRDHGVSPGLAAGIRVALDHYGTTGTYLSAVRDLAYDAARVVAGERDEAAPLEVAPDDGDDGPLDALVEREIAGVSGSPGAGQSPADDASGPSEGAGATDTPAEADVGADRATDSDATDGTVAGGEGPSDSGPTEGTVAESDADGPPDGDPTEGTVAEETAADARDERTSGGAPSESDQQPSPTADDQDSHEVDERESHEEETQDAQAVDAEDAHDVDAEEAHDVDTEEANETAEQASGDLAGTAADEDGASAAGGDVEPQFDLDEEERAEIESEYGTEFQSGTEVDEPGEADIQTPEPPEATGDGGDGTESGADAGGSAAEEGDLVDAVVEAMTELDEGDGAARSAVLETVADRTGASADTVEDAVTDALMAGRCFEPDDETLKPI